MIVDHEESAAKKRKASPSSPTEDVASKRTRFGERGIRNSKSDRRGSTSRATVKRNERWDEPRDERRNSTRGSSSPTASRERGSESAARPSADARKPPLTGPPASRHVVSQEEKKRGQRLFGGLLSTLSQTPSSSHHKRRLEIDRRQQEKAQQQRAEDSRRRAEKLAKLHNVRSIEQIDFDEQAMNTRHTSMLARAHSLQTKSEPRLYYRPWQLTEDEKRIIEEQICLVEATVNKEKAEFERGKERRLKELGASLRPPPRSAEVADGEPRSVDDNTNHRHDTPPPPPPSKARSASSDKDQDENGDEMVQDEEDTVLY
ncbi:pinin/SDK/memA/ protein conserved region-domain-containing protein [Podospora didyma]|uniref:Pinin/SDK/memA/ protein conserved region-domain-containing protein n=1 Tax=Podospora didyma TaxID=330526 RepID=A0AAE0KEI7_9PEZI|nr:pinin/SDK/memA/ protein conserved region-domain-containing protein [Podospora didyma]